MIQTSDEHVLTRFGNRHTVPLVATEWSTTDLRGSDKYNQSPPEAARVLRPPLGFAASGIYKKSQPFSGWLFLLDAVWTLLLDFHLCFSTNLFGQPHQCIGVFRNAVHVVILERLLDNADQIDRALEVEAKQYRANPLAFGLLLIQRG